MKVGPYNNRLGHRCAGILGGPGADSLTTFSDGSHDASIICGTDEDTAVYETADGTPSSDCEHTIRAEPGSRGIPLGAGSHLR